jgi:hypothetical protein
MKVSTRKIIKQGGSYLISLPIFWIKSKGVDVEKVDVKLEKDASLKIEAVPTMKNLE